MQIYSAPERTPLTELDSLDPSSMKHVEFPGIYLSHLFVKENGTWMTEVEEEIERSIIELDPLNVTVFKGSNDREHDQWNTVHRIYCMVNGVFIVHVDNVLQDQSEILKLGMVIEKAQQQQIRLVINLETNRDNAHGWYISVNDWIRDQVMGSRYLSITNNLKSATKEALYMIKYGISE